MDFPVIDKRTFLGALAKLRKATISFIVCVCLSLRMENLGSHLTDSREISYLSIFRKLVEKMIKTDQELDEIIKHKNIINFIRAQRLSWLGQGERMQGMRMVKAIYCWYPIASRPTGRPKTRWIDRIRKDIQKLKVPNWKTLKQD